MPSTVATIDTTGHQRAASDLVGGQPSPREVLQEVVGQAQLALGCDRSYALLWEDGRFVPAAVKGLSMAGVAALKQFTLEPGAVPALDRALRQEEPLAIEDAAASGLVPAAMASALELGALLLTPIRHGGPHGPALGLLLFDFDRTAGAPAPFTSTRLHLAAAVAEELSLPLENALLHEQARQRTQRLEALNELGLALAARTSRDPARLFALLYPRVAAATESATCLLALIDEEGPTMSVWGALDGMPQQPATAIPLAEDALSVALREGRQLTFTTREALPVAGALPPALLANWGADFAPPEAAVYLPLRLRQQTLGALAVCADSARLAAGEQVAFLTTVAAQMTIAVEHGRLLDQTLQAREQERQALVDAVLDGALQELASCGYRLDLCLRLSEREQHERCRAELTAIREQLTGRSAALRAAIGGLRPTGFDRSGLPPTGAAAGE